MTDRSLDPGGIQEPKTPKPAQKHHMERTKLTDWKKLAKNRKLQTEKKQQTSSIGKISIYCCRSILTEPKSILFFIDRLSTVGSRLWAEFY